MISPRIVLNEYLNSRSDVFLSFIKKNGGPGSGGAREGAGRPAGSGNEVTGASKEVLNNIADKIKNDSFDGPTYHSQSTVAKEIASQMGLDSSMHIVSQDELKAMDGMSLVRGVAGNSTMSADEVMTATASAGDYQNGWQGAGNYFFESSVIGQMTANAYAHGDATSGFSGSSQGHTEDGKVYGAKLSSDANTIDVNKVSSQFDQYLDNNNIDDDSKDQLESLDEGSQAMLMGYDAVISKGGAATEINVLNKGTVSLALNGFTFTKL